MMNASFFLIDRMTDIHELQRHSMDCLDRFGDIRVAVIGDIILDSFVRGVTTRVSPEAPVPVLKYRESKKMLGGAGNVAHNLSSLGVAVSLFGAVGNDRYGQSVIDLAKKAGIESNGIYRSDDVVTTYKERVISDGQHIVRVDYESDEPIELYATDAFTALQRTIDTYDAIVIADYIKGVLSDKMIAGILDLAQTHAIPVIVDAKPARIMHYTGVTLVTPNNAEAIEATGVTDAVAAAEQLADELNASVLLTRGPDGVMLVHDGDMTPYEAKVREVIDVSGAGDTVSAIATAMIAAGNSLEGAAYASNLGGGHVVTKTGTATISRSEIYELIAPMAPSTSKMHTMDSLMQRIATERADGQKIVVTNGCFDIFHKGHVAYLEEAKQQGDFLVVAVNADASVRALKGDTRPVNPLESRMAVLAGLASVDAVVSFDADTAVEIVKVLQPDVYVKGGDYTRDDLRGKEGGVVESYGGTVHLTGDYGQHSTSKVISKILDTHSPDDAKKNVL